MWEVFRMALDDMQIESTRFCEKSGRYDKISGDMQKLYNYWLCVLKIEEINGKTDIH